MEAAGVGDLARSHSARDVLDFVGDRVPLAMRLFGAGVRWCSDGVTFDDQRIEIYHLGMRVKKAHDTFARDTRR